MKRQAISHIKNKALTAIFGFLCSTAQAQSTGLVHTIVVPFGAGGSTDFTARIIAEKMGPLLKSPVIVDNKPGAGSRVAAGYVKNTKPDGNTMLFGVTATAAIIPFLYENVSYDFPADYKAVAQVATSPIAIIVPGSSPFKNINDLLKYGHKNPGSLNFGASGIGNLSHLTWYRFGQVAKLKSTIVPFRSGSSVLVDLIANHLDAAVDSVGEYVEAHRAGRVRVLATFGSSRLQVLPDVPTISEQGFQGLNAESWYGVFVPSKTPDGTVKQLQDAIAIAVNDPETQSRMGKIAIQASYKNSADFTKIVSKDIAVWGTIVKESGIKPE